MIYIEEVYTAVNNAYKTLADIQYILSVKEPVSGDVRTFNRMYTLSTKIVANLEYIDMLDMNKDLSQNREIESIIYSLKEITNKIRTQWV